MDLVERMGIVWGDSNHGLGKSIMIDAWGIAGRYCLEELFWYAGGISLDLSKDVGLEVGGDLLKLVTG